MSANAAVHRMDSRPDELIEAYAARLVVAAYMTNGFVLGWFGAVALFYARPGFTRHDVLRQHFGGGK